MTTISKELIDEVTRLDRARAGLLRPKAPEVPPVVYTRSLRLPWSIVQNPSHSLCTRSTLGSA